MKLAAAVLLLSASALAGCTATAPNDEPAASEAALTTITKLDRVTPAEVAATYTQQTKAGLEACIAGHPEITKVDAANLDAFYRVGSEYHWDVREAIEGILAEQGGVAIATSALGASIEPWAKRELSKHTDSDGFYAPPREGQLAFYYAELHTREAKAHALAAAPGGKSFAELRAIWREVQSARGNLDSAWLRPVKVSGEPTLGEIEKAMRIPFDASFESWGNTAVDEFEEADEGPNGAREFAPLAVFLKSSAIKKRWLFQAYDSNYSTNVLVVLDEHNQLWGMQMGYSK